MASCTRIDNWLQAYIDGELAQSDRVILERHVAECRQCAQLMAKHRGFSADMYETLSGERLNRDLTAYTLEHLPEMARPEIDVVRLNRRAKHPAIFRERLVRLIPIAAAVFLLILAGIMNKNWPEATLDPGTIGIVSHASGETYRFGSTNSERDVATLKRFIIGGERYETGPASALMINLLGPSQIRLDENTRVLIHEERRISVEKGRVYLDVDGAKRLFKVLTPMGDITVFGTSFDVSVDNLTTTVAVKEGEVQIGHVEDDNVFGILHRGEAVSVKSGDRSIAPKAVDVDQVTSWASRIVPDDEAQALFASRLLPLQDAEEVVGRSGYFIDTLGKPLKSIIIDWETTTPNIDYSGYELFVYNHRNEALFRSRVPGDVFSQSGITSHEIPYFADRRENLRHVFVKLVPQDGDRKQEIEVKDVRARIGT